MKLQKTCTHGASIEVLKPMVQEDPIIPASVDSCTMIATYGSGVGAISIGCRDLQDRMPRGIKKITKNCRPAMDIARHCVLKQAGT